MRPHKLPWFDCATALLSGLAVGAGVYFVLLVLRGVTAQQDLQNVLWASAAVVLVTTVKFPLPCVRYVGEKGVYQWAKVFGKEQTNLFLFSPDATCTAHVYEMRQNGVPTGTDYRFTFRHPDQSAPFVIEGRFLDFLGKIHSDNSYHFARSAEAALQEYLYPQVRAAWLRRDPLTFLLTNRASLTLNGQTLIFQEGGKKQRVALSEIRRMEIVNGSVSFVTDPQRAAFPSLLLATIPNAPLLLRLIDEGMLPQQKAA